MEHSGVWKNGDRVRNRNGFYDNGEVYPCPAGTEGVVIDVAGAEVVEVKWDNGTTAIRAVYNLEPIE